MQKLKEDGAETSQDAEKQSALPAGFGRVPQLAARGRNVYCAFSAACMTTLAFAMTDAH